MDVDFKEQAFLVYQAFSDMARYEMSLSTTLQSLAPTNKETSLKSVQYLYEDSVMLRELNERLKDLMLSRSFASSQKRSGDAK